MIVNSYNKWIQEHITRGDILPPRYEHTCHEIVAYYQAHPDEQAAIGEALLEVMRAFDWSTPVQLESAAYLVVNLEVQDGLPIIMQVAANREKVSWDYAVVAIAAIRSFPYKELAVGQFHLQLFEWLSVPQVAKLVFETLADLHYQNAGAYFMAVTFLHQDAELHKAALSHLYFRAGDVSRGQQELEAVLNATRSVVRAIETHEFLPDEVKRLASRDVATPSATFRVSPAILQAISGVDFEQIEAAESIISTDGLWG